MVPPNEDLAQELEKEMIRHVTQSEERWGEHWRWKDEACDRMTQTEVAVANLEKWQANVVGKFAVVTFIGSLLGGAVVTVIIKLATGRP